MRRPSIRKSLALLAAGSLVTALAACGGSTPSGPGGDDGGGGDSAPAGSATIWGLTGGSQDVLQDSLDRWNKDNPDEQIAVEWFANDAYKEKIRTAVGSGNAPTLIYGWGGGTLADYANNDSVVDLTDDLSGTLENVLPSVVDNGKVDGKIYAVPMNQSQPVMLYYNKKIFKDAGLDVPTTYDELLKDVKTFSDQGIIPIALAGQSIWPELMYIEYLVDRIGGPDAFQGVLDGKKDAWSDPAFTEALQKIQELVDAGAFGKGFASTSADGGGDTALVYTGRAAMVLQGAWTYPDFVKNAPDFVSDGDLGFATFPAVEGGQGDPANIAGNPSNFLSVSSSATEDQQKIAIDYLKESTYSDETVADFLKVGTVPPLKGIDDKIASSDNADYLQFVYQMVSDAPHFDLSWDQALPPSQAQELLDNLSRIFLKQITPKEFVDNMNGTL